MDLKKNGIMKGKNLKVIVSGGGTGGHIFPAISIANAIKELYPDTEILFVGAEGRMEMQRVPDAGYKIIGLPIQGFNRKNPFKNIAVLFKIWKSQRMAKKIITDFQPDVAVGVGGYASGPLLNQAAKMGVPTLIQEQNSYAGVTNKLLAKKAKRICVAYEGMERFFPKEKILMTGNPVRQSLTQVQLTKEEAKKALGLQPGKKTILVIGGSLGARTVNESILQHLQDIRNASDVQILWQHGKFYAEEIKAALDKADKLDNLTATAFIKDMDKAYAAADLVISRAGASSISEICLLEKPSILVPSPNVAEDHQTKNAMALSDKGAAILVRDADAREKLVEVALTTVKDEAKLQSIAANAGKMAFRDSAKVIAQEVWKIANE